MSARMRVAGALPYVAGGVGVVFIALFIGMLAATGFIIGDMLIAGVLLGAMLLMLPMTALTVILVVVTFVIQGSLLYFLRMQQAAWLPYLLCILLSIKTIRFAPPSRVDWAHGARPAWNAPPVICLLLYVAALVGATLLNTPPMFQVVIGLKNALPLWVAAALVYYGASLPRFIDRMWAVFNLVLLVQLPLVLYQHFVIVPRRRDADTTGMDAVVGSFGGLIDGGGLNATLVIFALLVMGYQLALWARGAAPLRRVVLYWVVGLIVVVSGEVKAVLLWIPLLVFYVLRRRVLASFGTAIASVILCVALVGGLFAAYSALYWQKIAHKSNADLISRMYYFFDASNVNYQTGEISRGASIALWVQDPKADLPRRVLGYGPGASRISATGGLGEVAQRYAPLSIAATSIALLLWDTGIFGTLAFFGIVLGTAWMLWKQSNDPRLSPRERAGADALGVTMLIFLSLMAYNRGLNDEPSVQLILAIGLGCALHWRTAGRLPAPTSRNLAFAT